MSSSQDDLKATKRFVYPFTDQDGKEIRTASTYYQALAQADEGYYPLGNNGQWHGGIHFNKATAAAGGLKQDAGVRCIADGEVVAWRIDKTYPQVSYPKLVDEGTTIHEQCTATYSTGFVLVRHRLALPQPPQSGDRQAQSATSDTTTPGHTAQASSVEFYSLYMHLMSWDNYLRHPAAKHRPHLWPADGPMYRADKASDHYTQERDHNKRNPYAPTDDRKGVNLRKKGEHKTYLGFAPKDSVLTLGNKETSHYYEVLAVDGDNLALMEGLDASALQDVVAWKEELTAMPSQPSQFGQVVVPDTPIAIKAGDIVGHLGLYERFADVKDKPMNAMTKPTVYAPDSDREMMHLEVFTTDPKFLETCRQHARYASDSEKSLLSIQKDTQLTLPTQADTAIAAGTLVQVIEDDNETPWVKVLYATGSQETIIAHANLGTYRNESYALEAKTRKALHTAIPTVAASNFIGRVAWTHTYYTADHQQFKSDITQAERSTYTARGVIVHSGTYAWIQRSDLPVQHEAAEIGTSMEAWSSFPLQADATDGPKAATEMVTPIHDLPERAAAPAPADNDNDNDNDKPDQNKTTRWWQVEVDTVDGSQAKGWACEQGQSGVSLCSPWDWPGFKEETANATPDQLYAAATLAGGNYTAAEKPKLEALAHKAQAGPLFKHLCQIVDSTNQGPGKHHGTLSSADIIAAMHDPNIVRRMTHLIVKNKSEWAEPDTLKTAIEPLIPERSKKDWEAEMGRVEKLAWWSAALPSEKHLALGVSMASIVNLYQNAFDVLKKLIRELGDAISEGEGTYYSYNTGTYTYTDSSGNQHQRVGHSYIQNGPVDITAKTINEIIATGSKSPHDTTRLFATGKYQTIISTLKNAKRYMHISGNEKYTREMQEKVFSEYLLRKAGGGVLGGFIFNGSGTVDDAQHAASKEWASIAAPEGKALSPRVGGLSDGTKSYYESGANSANARSTNKLRNALNKIKALYE